MGFKCTQLVWLFINTAVIFAKAISESFSKTPDWNCFLKKPSGDKKGASGKPEAPLQFTLTQNRGRKEFHRLPGKS